MEHQCKEIDMSPQLNNHFSILQLQIKHICQSLERSFSPTSSKSQKIFTPLIEYLNLWSEVFFSLKRISIKDENLINRRFGLILNNLRGFYQSYFVDEEKAYKEWEKFLREDIVKSLKQISIFIKDKIDNEAFSFEAYERLMDIWYEMFTEQYHRSIHVGYGLP